TTAWCDTLDKLDGLATMHQAMVGGTAGDARWRAAAVAAYKEFEHRVHVAWVEQLLAMTVTTGKRPERPPSSADMEVGAAFNDQHHEYEGDEYQEESVPTHDWTGWSFNRFVRRHFTPTAP